MTHPAFTVGGSFQALAVEELGSEEEEEEEVEEEQEQVQTPSKRNKTRQRNRKLNKTNNNNQKQKQKENQKQQQPKQLPPPPPTPTSKTLKPITTTTTNNTLQDIITSPTTSTVNSIPTSPSTTDLEEEEESFEVDHHPRSSDQTQITTPHALDQSLDHPRSALNEYPQSPSTPRPTSQRDPQPTALPPNSAKNSAYSPTLIGNPQISQFGEDHTPGKKWQTVLTRVTWSLVMLTGFITLMALGHLYLIILIFIIQLLVFREVTNLFLVGYKASAREQAKKQQLSEHQSLLNSTPHHPPAVKEKKKIKDVALKNRTNKIMSWYFFGVANYFLYGESIIYYFKHISYIDDWYLIQFGRHHRFISLLLYLIGFLGFVTNLDRGHLRRQFGLFSWIHMSLLLIIVFGQFMVNNILEGLIWFWVPASLVIMNDVAAYVFGMLFGKHQLIKLSPKKTVEGFVGGFFMTVIFGFLWGSLFMGWNYMICPVKELGMSAFSEVRCEPNDVFKWRSARVGELLTPELAPVVERVLARGRVPTQVWWTPFQLHCLVLATFAGLVAPFGGFFASGFKRAFNVKDFGHTIPGHGGLTDRFDCQFIMGLFTYFYYSSLVKEDDGLPSLPVSPASILDIVASSLSDAQLLELFASLQALLVNKGLLRA